MSESRRINSRLTRGLPGEHLQGDSPLLTMRDLERLHEMKRRQRFVEYLSLSAMQGFLAAGLLHSTNLTLSFSPIPFVFASAWLLAQAREKRRTMGQHDTKRLLGDTIESFGLALSLALAIIVARWFGFGVAAMMTYLAMTILAYFLGSFIGEMWWASRLFPRLDLEHKMNYIINLNRSVIFPYNLKYLRSIFRNSSPKSPTPKHSADSTETLGENAKSNRDAALNSILNNALNNTTKDSSSD